ncbi:DNA polymerase III subunit alpha [Marinicaulis aureus]|uniref:DNA polymerase III subunit alpha n=1 Tax=Hyphococcus aureus TaxID=2666033 RepID=A0ABW1KZ30_9PROT
MTAQFIHLHLHSAYSLAEGAIPINRVKELCLETGMPAVAVTDTNNLFGALEASVTLAGAGIQPIVGIQQAFDGADFELQTPRGGRQPSLVLLAQTEAGYQNLLKITSEAFLNSRSDEGPCAGLDFLKTHAGDMICLTGGYDGPIDRLLREDRKDEARAALEKLMRLFPARLYVEVQRHAARDEESIEEALIDLAYDLDLPLVATNEPFFPAPDDHEAHDALMCVAEGAYVHQDDRRKVTPDHYFKSAEEMAALFADLPEAIENTIEVAQRCAYRPRFRDPILPRFAGEGEEAAAAEAMELERQAREGLKARLRVIEPAAEESEYWDRLKVELDIINRMGFPGYFLIVSDFIKWAKREDVPVGPGRGSGAGSLVAWSLTITDLDPLRFGLLFERFLNPERVSMPDFDIDFCQDRRDEVIRYVQEKYGRDRVAQIITFGKLQARAVLRDVGRVLNMPFGQVDRICKLVPNNPANPVTLAEALETEPRLKEQRDEDEGVAALIEKALKLEGLYRHASTHAAGVVIGDRPLDELVPLYRDPRSDMPATQFNMKWVEPAGLVKFDFLGLKTLTVIARAVGYAAERGVELKMDEIPLDDKPTFEMLGEGAATGVFQLESTGMRSTLRAMKPDTLEDIIALVSLYRPGPMENIPTYIERKQGLQEPDYLHPLLEGVLKETYGVIIYQEQVMQIAQILSGYSLGEADLLRRAMGKKKKEEMDLQRVRFIDGAKEKNVDPAKASSIFDLVQKFAGYGFNKSHAAAYAYIAYQTAWLKANYPAELLAASMSLDRANTDKLAIFLKEARRTEVEVRPPHINHSEADFSVKDGAIVYALSAVKNVGEGAMAHIAAERSKNGRFKDLIDFAERVDLKLIGKRSLENLARAGALDDLCASRAQAFASAELLIRTSAAHHEEQKSDQGGLFALDDAPALAKPRLPTAEEWTPQVRLDEERAAVGFYFSGHPLDDYEKELKRLNVVTYADAQIRAKSGRAALQMAGVIRTVRMRRSKSGKPFAWVELSDQSGEFEITVFSETLNTSRDLMESGSLVLVGVTVEERDGDVRFTCETMRKLDEAAAATVSQLRVSVTSPDALDGLKRRLASVRPASPRESGSVVVVMRLPETGREVDLALPGVAACTPAMRGALRSINGVADVELI